MADVIDYDGLAVSVPDACPFCGAARRWRDSSVIGTYVCGTAKNCRPDGQHHQTYTCLEGAPAFAATAARAEIVAWLEWRFNRMQAMARDLCAEEITGDAGTYRDIADAIESGAPQRWAVGREGHSSPPKGEV